MALRRQEAAECGGLWARASEMDADDATLAAGLSGESLRLVFLEVARVSVVWRRKSERAARDAAAAGGGQAGGGGKRAAALTFCFSLSACFGQVTWARSGSRTPQLALFSPLFAPKQSRDTS
jgi:hypothetical protein